MRKSLVVIGVGALGMRHLQSLITLNDEFDIFGVEPNMGTNKALHEEFQDNARIVETVDELPEEIEACVISTNSNVRRAVFEELTDKKKVHNILFEKVLFQTIEDYYWVKDRLDEFKIHAWVNCDRREMESYKWLKEEMRGVSSFTYSENGGEWGLCCNAIHMIDLILFLSDEDEYDMDASIILPGMKESKRKGFYELYGTIAGKTKKCVSFQISCMKDNNSPSIVMIGSDRINIVIDEVKQTAFVAQPNNNWEWEERKFEIPYVSQISAGIVKKMIKGDCNLPTYDLAMKEHLTYITKLQKEFNKNGWKDEKLCPIT